MFLLGLFPEKSRRSDVLFRWLPRPTKGGSMGRIGGKRGNDADRVGRATKETERALAVEVISSQKLAATLSGEGASYFAMGGGPPEYRRGGWKAVSHTFELQKDGSAILTYLLER